MKRFILIAAALLLAAPVVAEEPVRPIPPPPYDFDWSSPPNRSATAPPAIEIPEVTPLGQELLAKVDIKPGERLIWIGDDGSTPVQIGLGRAHVFATPGTHKLRGYLIPPGDADPVMLGEVVYSVGSPGPTPPPPIVKTLAELAGALRPTFIEIVSDGRAGLAQFQTVAQVQRFFVVSYDMAKIPQDQPAAVEIKKRIDAAASGSLADAKVRQSLDAALAKIASDLGTEPPGPTPPPVPPVVEGKRLVVVLHEVDDDSAAFANFRVNTANNSAAAQYFKANGHIVQFLEEEQKDQSGQPHPLVEKLKALGVGVPAAFILDPATKVVLYQTKLGPDVTADNLVEYTKRGGG